MKILIMRHGEASQNASTDALRPLTARGKLQSISIAQMLNAEHFKIDAVLVSPYLRAQQTFAEMARELMLPNAETLSILTPSGDATMVADYIATLSREGVNTLLVVSHLPLVGYLVNEFCHGINPPMFSTGSIASISLNIETMFGSFEWLSSPNC